MLSCAKFPFMQTIMEVKCAITKSQKYKAKEGSTSFHIDVVK